MAGTAGKAAAPTQHQGCVCITCGGDHIWVVGSIVISVPLLMAVNLEHSCSVAIGLSGGGAWLVSLL